MTRCRSRERSRVSPVIVGTCPKAISSFINGPASSFGSGRSPENTQYELAQKKWTQSLTLRAEWPSKNRVENRSGTEHCKCRAERHEFRLQQPLHLTRKTSARSGGERRRDRSYGPMALWHWTRAV
jgi:hypothetical protein